MSLGDLANQELPKYRYPLGTPHFFRVDEVRFVDWPFEAGEDLDDLVALLSHVIREAGDADSVLHGPQDCRNIVHLQHGLAAPAGRLSGLQKPVHVREGWAGV